MFDRCLQINLQQGFGGGEVYAATFARTIAALGIESLLLVHPRATAWARLPLNGVRVVSGEEPTDLALPPTWIVCHHRLPEPSIAALKAHGHFVTAFAHMPLYGRDPAPLRPFQCIYAVSHHVIASLHAAGIDRVYPEPLWGVAALDREGGGGPIRRCSRYDWDRRKLRDRLLGALEPLWRSWQTERTLVRRPGFTLGIVSRLTPIKQFPLLFRYLAPILARHPEAKLEIFGSGGYASVRDLDRELRLLARRVRFWGEQTDVKAVYGQIDALLTGLPEKEALGLNVIEAQACGVPVLAPDAPPFDETVIDGVTGLRYRDPRLDQGVGFEAALMRMISGQFRFDAHRAAPHLARFSRQAFTERVARLVASVESMQPQEMEP